MTSLQALEASRLATAAAAAAAASGQHAFYSELRDGWTARTRSPGGDERLATSVFQAAAGVDDASSQPAAAGRPSTVVDQSIHAAAAAAVAAQHAFRRVEPFHPYDRRVF